MCFKFKHNMSYLSPIQLPEPYRRSFPKEAIRHEHKKKHKHKKLEVKKHEAAAAAAAEQPHPSTLESTSGASVDSHIPSGHAIPGMGQVTAAQTSGTKPLAGTYVLSSVLRRTHIVHTYHIHSLNTHVHMHAHYTCAPNTNKHTHSITHYT